MEKFFSSYKTLIGFLIASIFIQMLLGDDVLQAFLWLVLFSMLILNYKVFTSFLSRL